MSKPTKHNMLNSFVKFADEKRVEFYKKISEVADAEIKELLMMAIKPKPSAHDFLCAEVESVCGSGPNDVSVRWRGGIVGKGDPLYSKRLALYAESLEKQLAECAAHLHKEQESSLEKSIKIDELQREIDAMKTQKPA